MTIESNNEEDKRKVIRQRFTTLRLMQLQRLLNIPPEYGVTWKETVYEKIPYYDTYTYRKTTQQAYFEPSLVESLRAHGIDVMIRDLKKLEVGKTTEDILLKATTFGL